MPPPPLAHLSWNPTLQASALQLSPAPPISQGARGSGSPDQEDCMLVLGRAAGLTFTCQGTATLTSQESLGDLVLVPSGKCTPPPPERHRQPLLLGLSSQGDPGSPFSPPSPPKGRSSGAAQTQCLRGEDVGEPGGGESPAWSFKGLLLAPPKFRLSFLTGQPGASPQQVPCLPLPIRGEPQKRGRPLQEEGQAVGPEPWRVPGEGLLT